MDEDRMEGAGKQMGGRLKESAGRLSGDTKLQAEGKADRMEGKAQNFWGGLKDMFRRDRHRDRRM
jgi:uncharacterized protein YjbJ (UPF0337 family)